MFMLMIIWCQPLQLINSLSLGKFGRLQIITVADKGKPHWGFTQNVDAELEVLSVKNDSSQLTQNYSLA